MNPEKRSLLFYHVWWNNGCHAYYRPDRYKNITLQERKYITHVDKCVKVAILDGGIWTPLRYV